jgi:phage terminase large subunit-like protein
VPKGARKGETRHTGPRIAPASLATKLTVPGAMASDRAEVQAADVESRKHAHGRARHGAVAASVERRRFQFDEYEINPVEGHYPHAAQAKEYASLISHGKRPACKWAKLAAKRYLAMLDRDDMIFNPYEAERACNFMEAMPHVKGSWATRTITLEPWQAMVICAMFGFYWLKDTTRRVVRLAYVEIPRKNAKSTLAAAIGLYMLAEDGEEGAEVYSAATTHKQALAIFDTAKAMARRHRAFAEAHDLVVQSHEIKVWGTLGKFEALHAQGETLDGLNVSCALIDELHAHKTRAVYDVLETAMGARRNPLMFIITTAGVNRAGICYEVRDYVKKLLDGVIDEFTTFGIIYTLDDEDAEKKDYWNPKVWAKCNPNLNVSINEDELHRLAQKARVSRSALNNFLTKHLNVWVNASTSWLGADGMMKLERAGDKRLKAEMFKGEECKLGLDLATKLDVNSKARVFRREINGQWHFFALMQHYLPQARVEGTGNDEGHGDQDQYAQWAEDGWLQLTPGEVIDLDTIEDEIVADAEVFRVNEVAYDPYQATQLAKHLSDDGFNMIEIRPTVINFSEPMKVLEQLIISGRFHFDGDPVLLWMFSNVVVQIDKKDNIFPQKEFPQNKIDGVVALLMALNRWLAEEDTGSSVYETQGVMTL